MLDALDAVPWTKLTHAYGSAADVPALIRSLVSPNKKTRDEAIYQLYGNIWHQGTVYEATAHAVPFLIELLDAPKVACKPDVLGLLAELARGNSYLDVHQSMDHYHGQRETKEFQGQVQHELEWVRAARKAVLAGLPTYRRLVTDPDPTVRMAVVNLLGGFREKARSLNPILLDRVVKEADPVVKAELVLAACSLRAGAKRRAEDVAYFTKLSRRRSEPAVVRFAATYSVVALGTEADARAALPVFRATMTECRAEIGRLSVFQTDSPVGVVAGVLMRHPRLWTEWLVEMFGHPHVEFRTDAVYQAFELCRHLRVAPMQIVPRLAPLIADPESGVREWVARVLPWMGEARQLAIGPLEELADHPNRAVVKLVRSTLTALRRPREQYFPDKWLQPPTSRKSVAALVKVLERATDPKGKVDYYSASEAAKALEFAENAQTAVPVLRAALNHNYQGTRIHAARALWKISRDPAEVLPTLLEELRCRPAGLLVADCLGDMGRHAAPAVPALRRCADSEVRMNEGGTLDDWIDEDEGFREATRVALRRIEADGGS